MQIRTYTDQFLEFLNFEQHMKNKSGDSSHDNRLHHITSFSTPQNKSLNTSKGITDKIRLEYEKMK